MREPTCPFGGDQINKLLYIQTLEYYSAVGKNQEAVFELTWNDLQDINSEKKQV